jgi:hypothetical protein
MECLVKIVIAMKFELCTHAVVKSELCTHAVVKPELCTHAVVNALHAIRAGIRPEASALCHIACVRTWQAGRLCKKERAHSWACSTLESPLPASAALHCRASGGATTSFDAGRPPGVAAIRAGQPIQAVHRTEAFNTTQPLVNLGQFVYIS